MAGEVTLIVAFVAGLVSFLSPCILPIIPGFLAYLAGGAADEKNARWRTFTASVFFVFGFSTVFAILGVILNTLLESVAYDAQIWIARIGGVIIMIFGVYLMGLIKIKFLERAHTITVKKKFSSRHVTSFVFGAAFAAGWTPCVGAALGAILGLAATAPGAAFWLLMSYALGLGVPFLIIGAFAAEAGQFMNRFAKAASYITKTFGALLVILGILIFTQKLALLSDFSLVEQLIGL